MKSRSAVLFLLVLLGSSRSGLAGTNRFDLYGGLSVPNHPYVFRVGWSPGFSGAVGFGRQLNPKVAILGTLDYSRFPLNDEYFVGPSFVLNGGGASVTYVSVCGEWTPTGGSGDTKGFFLGGLGFYRVAVAGVTGRVLAEPVPGADENALGFQFGTGLRHKSAVVQVTYILGMTEDDRAGHFTIRVGYAGNPHKRGSR